MDGRKGTEVGGGRRVVAVTRAIERDARREHAFRPQAEIDVEQLLKAAQHEPGAYQQHDRDRDLGHHQRPPHPQARARDRAGAFAQSRRRIATQHLKGRRHAEEKPARDRECQANASTPPSIWISRRRGRSSGAMASRVSSAKRARSSPRAPPTSASTRLSVRSCRRRRERPAPIAVRSAISRSRVEARASRRLATLAQAISSTKATAASRTTIAGRIDPTT